MAARQRQILRHLPVKFHLHSKVNFKLVLDLFQRSHLKRCSLVRFCRVSSRASGAVLCVGRQYLPIQGPIPIGSVSAISIPARYHMLCANHPECRHIGTREHSNFPLLLFTLPFFYVNFNFLRYHFISGLKKRGSFQVDFSNSYRFSGGNRSTSN